MTLIAGIPKRILNGKLEGKIRIEIPKTKWITEEQNEDTKVNDDGKGRQWLRKIKEAILGGQDIPCAVMSTKKKKRKRKKK